MEFLLGLLVGSIFTSLFVSAFRTTHGVLRIDHSDPEKDLYRFEIDDIETLQEKKVRAIVLKIDHDADLSQN